MNKTFLVFVVVIPVILVVAYFVVKSQEIDQEDKAANDVVSKGSDVTSVNEASQVTDGKNIDETAKNEEKTGPDQENPAVPYPSPEDMIGVFFRNLDENNVQEAIRVMHPSTLVDDSIKQAYGVQFNEVESAKVIKIEKSNESEWTDSMRIFKVTSDVKMSEDTSNAPIPYYGWDSDPDIKWFVMEKDGNIWKISEIATGP
jgi:hypothetical protein